MSIILSLFLAVPCFFPACWRILTNSITQPAGLLSDLGLGLILYGVVWRSPRWVKAFLLVFWALTQIMSQELMAAMKRLPSWQDLQYLVDPTFVKNTTAGMHLANPGFTLIFVLLTATAILVPPRRPGWGKTTSCLLAGLLLLGLHYPVSRALGNQSVAARYNPLHWFITDASAKLFSAEVKGLSVADLPSSLKTVDLDGKRLLAKGRAKNVLIVILEGVPGIAFPEIRREMHVEDIPFQMDKLSKSTLDGMLVPDFVDHSHQTIRGLYAIHCGDFSKFSYEMPKAMELQNNPDRAAECLPAQLERQGWQSHYLQGAGLQFMNKERAMPTMGFQHVHGVEWFTERTETDFIWGTTDGDFFKGAKKYIGELQAANKPWFLSLLTVATHQPFSATDEQAKKYGSRLNATMALLDESVATFVDGLRRDGVLEDTLVIITSDESHGADGADWYSSWGLGIVLTPEHELLPRIKKGTYGLVDIEASVLDYFNLPMPPSIIGRSIFRDYNSARDMVSYTSSKLRWQTADNFLYECGRDDTCRKIKNQKIIGPRPEAYEQDTENRAGRLFGLATVLDHKLAGQQQKQVLQFASGEIRQLPEKIKSEWTDNLTGAQYLDFPAKSKIHVDIKLKALTAPPEGIQMKLTLRQFEKEAGDIKHPQFPLLHAGEEGHIQFDFQNQKARQAFSFHLVGEGLNSSIQLQKFAVTIDREKG
ncbi:LTA synthase family protein [Desulfopila sp. IMCC35006]|uniref:LTA synthase family protein n=1 Tax=Desulfopila sp. IMCC35006 TaxID=2569542 RepID=UPI0010AC2A8B|nr:LTA synthase family protein [Desulfopila sp. IMCC35006]TKB26985.1 LTA synthase family protein [Desulfopila sp. IMCC35006]